MSFIRETLRKLNGPDKSFSEFEAHVPADLPSKQLEEGIRHLEQRAGYGFWISMGFGVAAFFGGLMQGDPWTASVGAALAVDGYLIQEEAAKRLIVLNNHLQRAFDREHDRSL